MAIRHPAIASKAAKAAKAARVAKARRHAAEGENTVEAPLSKSYTDPRDVLLKPVVSERATLLDENKYVRRRPACQQDPDQGGRLSGLRRRGHRGHAINRQGEAQAGPAPASASARRPSARSDSPRSDRIDIFGGPTA